MLTETDIHYLVGLLSLASNPDNVEIELGSRVLDTTTDTERDVDVTVTVKDDGRITAFKGLEVKNHSRKLDVTHIEQLACKLNDMPSITEKAIVSASGYARPAIRKADAHGIGLFELIDWNFSKQGFEHFHSEFVPMVQRSLEWMAGPHVRLNPTDKISEEDQQFIMANPKIYFGSDESKTDVPDLNSLLANLRSKVQHELYERLQNSAVTAQAPSNVNVTLNISDSPYVKTRSGKIIIGQALFTGQVAWIETQKPTHYKVLKRLGDEKPFAGCMVAELGTWGLMGLMVSNTDRTIRWIHVPISDRNRNKIFKQRVR
ncbi:MAG TPA: hypothetical protein VNN22_02140 [Verrucomicrobiae bacterium]|nr:hypothetical protein [Verrucomicrobiae bacterium]